MKIKCPICGKKLIHFNSITRNLTHNFYYEFWCNDCKMNITISTDKDIRRKNKMFEDMYNGTIYEDEDKAREVAKEEMEIEDYIACGDYSLEKLMKLVLKYCPDEIFNEITEAEENYFNERFCEIEEEK